MLGAIDLAAAQVADQFLGAPQRQCIDPLAQQAQAIRVNARRAARIIENTNHCRTQTQAAVDLPQQQHTAV